MPAQYDTRAAAAGYVPMSNDLEAKLHFFKALAALYSIRLDF